MTKQTDHKQVFGAGFRAGVKSILGEEEVSSMGLSATRIKILEEQQTGIAKKVYECVPRNEAWDARRITGELARLGSAPDLHIVQGCLSSLKDSGLVAEAVKGMFQRVKARPETPLKEVTAAAPVATKQATKSEPVEPLDILAAATSGLRGVAKQINEIASQIDDAVLAVSAQDNERSDEIRNLRQLAELIKGLSA